MQLRLLRFLATASCAAGLASALTLRDVAGYRIVDADPIAVPAVVAPLPEVEKPSVDPSQYRKVTLDPSVFEEERKQFDEAYRAVEHNAEVMRQKLAAARAERARRVAEIELQRQKEQFQQLAAAQRGEGAGTLGTSSHSAGRSSRGLGGGHGSFRSVRPPPFHGHGGRLDSMDLVRSTSDLPTSLNSMELLKSDKGTPRRPASFSQN